MIIQQLRWANCTTIAAFIVQCMNDGVVYATRCKAVMRALVSLTDSALRETHTKLKPRPTKKMLP